MINLYYCCGCSACESICPTKAITMQENRQGFLEPEINKTKCVNCGLCETKCPQNLDKFFKSNIEVYAVKTPIEKRMESQSGGGFAALAEVILHNSGIVYGVGISEDFSVEYFRIDNIHSLNKIKGSKYVQSDCKTAYTMVEQDLNDGKNVLFSGTPCYVAGLYSYLTTTKCDINLLITIDLVCHGVPSPKLYMDYIDLENKKRGMKAVGFVFRDKKWSLNEKYSRLIWDDKKSTLVNGYLRMYSSMNGFRQSCLSCKYADSSRVGDITVGDFWGIESIRPEFDDNRGVSLIIVNSLKGQMLFDKLNDNIDKIKLDMEHALIKQPAMRLKERVVESYDNFWNTYEKYGLEQALDKYCDYNTSCHIDLYDNKIRTFDYSFLYAHLRGIIKTKMPAAMRVLIRKFIYKG